MLKKVDLLPVGPAWNCDNITVTGDILGPREEFLTEDLELWWRDPVACIADLIGNTAFKDFIVYEPIKVKHDGQRYYSEMCTSDWWWKIQVCTHPTRGKIYSCNRSPVYRVEQLLRV